MRFVFIIATLMLLLAGCADTVDFTVVDESAPVGFWYGLWHGMIAVIAFVVSLFDDMVSVYAINNSGGWYDFGFLLGILSVWGGGCHMKCKSSADRKREKEWEEIGSKVEKKVMRELKKWVEDEENSTDGIEWGDISENVENKLKRKIREWAEKK